MHAYHTIRKLNPNVNLKYKVLSCLKFPSLRYSADNMTHYNTADDTIQHSAQTSDDTYTVHKSKVNEISMCLISNNMSH